MNAGLRGSFERGKNSGRAYYGYGGGGGGRVDEYRFRENRRSWSKDGQAPEGDGDAGDGGQAPEGGGDGGRNSLLLTLAHQPDTWQYMLAQLPLQDLRKMPQVCRGIAEGTPFDDPWLPFWRLLVVERAPGAIVVREFWRSSRSRVDVWVAMVAKMNPTLLGLARQPWRDVLQSVVALRLHGEELKVEKAEEVGIKTSKVDPLETLASAAALKEVELGLATLAARLMLGKELVQEDRRVQKRHCSRSGSAKQTLRGYFNSQVSDNNDVADMISWLYSVSYSVEFSHLGREAISKIWQGIVKRVVKEVVVPGLIDMLERQPPIVERVQYEDQSELRQCDVTTSGAKDAESRLAIVIASPLRLTEAVLGRVLAIGIAFSAVLAHEDVARVAVDVAESRALVLRQFFLTFLESFAASCQKTTAKSSQTFLPGCRESESMDVQEENSNQLSVCSQNVLSAEGSKKSKGQVSRQVSCQSSGGLAADGVSLAGRHVQGDERGVCREGPAETAELMSEAEDEQQRKATGYCVDGVSAKDGLMIAEDTEPESSLREACNQDRVIGSVSVSNSVGNFTGSGLDEGGIASTTALSFMASLFQQMKLGRVETCCFSTSWKCAGFEAEFRQAAESVLYDIFGLKFSVDEQDAEPLRVPRRTICERTPSDIEIRVWSPTAHRLKGAILPSECVHSSAFLLRTAEAVAEANNVSEAPWPSESCKRGSGISAAMTGSAIGEELKANYRSWTKAKEWVVLADVKAQQQLQQENLRQLHETRNQLLVMMREHERLLEEYQPLIQDQQLPLQRREQLRRICEDAMARLRHDQQYQLHLQEIENQSIVRFGEERRVRHLEQVQSASSQGRALERLPRENESGHRRKLDDFGSTAASASALPFVRMQVSFSPLGKGMTLVAFVRAMMKTVLDFEDDGRVGDGDQFHGHVVDEADIRSMDAAQRIAIKNFFGLLQL